MTSLDQEIKRRLASGRRQLTLRQLTDEVEALGYKLDRTMDARGQAKILTGDHAGETYPCLTTGIKEADTGLSAFNVNARRDANFTALQQLRRSDDFAVVRGFILDL
ncbi:MAG: hypothetical protein KGL39_45395 [Patescibacteria group bacterium]|nr:hypothetical protein [Patescibacteria group bacterium]